MLIQKQYNFTENLAQQTTNFCYFPSSLLITYSNFSSLILASIVMISFCILSERFFLKRKGLSDARVISITKKEYDFVVHFL